MSDIGDMVAKAAAVWIIIVVIVSAVSGWVLIEGAIWVFHNVSITINT